MTTTTLVCTDGSELATAAAVDGIRVLAPTDRTVVLCVVTEPHVVLPYDASGMAGAAIEPAEMMEIERDAVEAGQRHAEATAAAITGSGRAGVETKVVMGAPAHAICDVAAELSATTVVIGSRGHGGIKRAVLGSVSDHVVRHSPCPVLVTHVG